MKSCIAQEEAPDISVRYRKAKRRALPAKRGREDEQETSVSHDENDPGVANQAASKHSPFIALTANESP